jgi:uncharacterized protein (DUF433 family)
MDAMVMKTTLLPDTSVLGTDEHGVIRIASTRVTLDTLIDSFFDGASAETIAEQFPTLSLAEVYSTIGYYLRHRAEMDAYLERRRQEEEAIQQEIERQFPPEGVRARLLARYEKLKMSQNAPVPGG